MGFILCRTAANPDGGGTRERKARIAETVKNIDIPTDIKRGYLSEADLYFACMF